MGDTPEASLWLNLKQFLLRKLMKMDFVYLTTHSIRNYIPIQEALSTFELRHIVTLIIVQSSLNWQEPSLKLWEAPGEVEQLRKPGWDSQEAP